MKICWITAVCAAASMAQALMAQAVPPGAPDPIKPETVVAKVDGKDVTAQDYVNMFANAPQDFTQGLGKQPVAFLQEMFRLQYLADEGDKLKLGDKNPLKDKIEAERKLAIASARVSFEQDSYTVSQQELDDFYLGNQGRWSAAKIKVILLGFKTDAAGNANAPNSRSLDEAMKLAADLVQRLRGGADFAKLVEEYSDDKDTKAAGGDFGVPIKPTSNLPDDLKKAVFALKPGDIADPIRQPTAIYIVKLEEIAVQPLNDVVEDITQEIKSNHRNMWFNDLNNRFVPKLVKAEFFTQPVNPNIKPGTPLTIVGIAFKPDTVIATVAGADVTVLDFQNIVQNAPTGFIQQLGSKPDQFLQRMFLMNELAADGEKLKLGEKTPWKEQMEWQRKYDVATARVTYEQDSFQVTEAQINDFYNQNQSRWSAAKIHVILIGFKPDPVTCTTDECVKQAAAQAFQAAHSLNDRSQTEATKLAGDLVEKLRAGADFAKLVEQYSDDKESKSDGGDFGLTIKTTSSFRDDFKKAIFALKPGEISDPVRQDGGFYIIRLDEKKVQPLKEVIDPITKEIKANHRTEWLTGLNSRFAPNVLRPEFFAQVALGPQK